MYRIDLVRHGETELSHTLRGSTDDALTSLGWQQMQKTIEQFNAQFSQDQSWDMIISSPLQRCALFAKHISDHYSRPILLNENLKEMHFGDWEAKSTQWIYEQFPEQLSLFWQTPTQFTPPNAEPLYVFHTRILSAISEILMHFKQHQAQHALVVTHGGVIKMLKCLALKQPLDDLLKMSAELGQLTRFVLYDDLSLELLGQDE